MDFDGNEMSRYGKMLNVRLDNDGELWRTRLHSSLAFWIPLQYCVSGKVFMGVDIPLLNFSR